MGYTEFYNFLIPLYGLSLGMSAGAIGMLVGARSLLAVFLSIHVGVLMDRFDTRRVTLFLYSTASQTQSPVMAHLVEHLGTGPATPGTSFASPRAAADAAQPLADPTRCTSCTEVDKLLQTTYGTLTAWDPRYGLRNQTV